MVHKTNMVVIYNKMMIYTKINSKNWTLVLIKCVDITN